jgi:hypothetical protein
MRPHAQRDDDREENNQGDNHRNHGNSGRRDLGKSVGDPYWTMMFYWLVKGADRSSKESFDITECAPVRWVKLETSPSDLGKRFRKGFRNKGCLTG